MAEEFKVSIGSDLNESSFSSTEAQIKKRLDDLSINNPVEIKLGFKNKNEFQKELSSLVSGLEKAGKTKIDLSLGNKSSLPADIVKIDKSLDALSLSFAEIRKSIGTLDDSAGMKSLLTSINEVSGELREVIAQFRELHSVINGKNFTFNFDLGNKNPIQNNMAAASKGKQALDYYKQIVDQMNAEVKKVYNVNDSFKGAIQLIKNTKYDFNTLWSTEDTMYTDKAPIEDRIKAFRRYIDILKEANTINNKGLFKNVDFGITTEADRLVESAQKIKDGTQHIENLKSIFGGKNADLSGVSSQLDTIISKLGELNSSLQQITANIKIDGLSSEFSQLSQTIQAVVNNVSTVRTAISSGVSGAASSVVEVANRIENINLTHSAEQINNVKDAMSNLGFSNTAIDKVVNDLASLDIQIKQIKTNIREDGMLDLTVKGIDKVGNQVSVIRGVRKEIQELKDGTQAEVFVVKNLGTTVTQQFNQIKAQAKEVTNAYNRLIAVSKEIDGISLNLSKLDASKSSNQIDVLTTKLDALEKEYLDLRSNLNGTLPTNILEILGQSANETNDKINLVAARIKDLKTAMASKITLKFDNTVNNDIFRVESSLEKIKLKTTSAMAAQEKFNAAIAAMKKAIADNDVDKIRTSYDEYKRSLKEVELQIRKNQAVERQSLELQKLNAKRNDLSASIDMWLHRNTAASKKFGDQLRQIQAQLKQCDATQLDRLSNEFKEVKRQAELAGLTGLSVMDRIKRQFSQYSVYFSTASLVTRAAMGLRSMYNNVVEVDTAMTGLYRVTDLTAQEYDKLYDNMIASAKEYGATLVDTINSTADWVRLGFDANTANRLTEITSMYQHISDLDNSTAVENLVTAYKGFQNELLSLYDGDVTKAVEYIADIYNDLGNKYAVSAEDVGAALSKSASSLDLAGNTIQETAAMATGIIEVTQDPEKSGNALKILSLRLRGMKGELEELGEEADENVESISKMQTQIMRLTNNKVNIFDDDGNFKSTYDIMQGIAEIYDDLSSTDQADLLETIAGKNRANDVAALLSNWQQVEKAVLDATNAEGSAATENAKYIDSVQGRIDTLKASWQALSNTAMGSDFLKSGISMLSGFTSGLDAVIDKIGVMPTIIGAIAAGLSFKNVGFFKTIEDQASLSGIKITSIFRQAFDAINSYKTANFSYNSGFSAELNQDVAALQNYINAVRNGIPVSEAFEQNLRESSVAAREYAQSMDVSKLSTEAFTLRQREGQLALQAQDRSWTNCSILIDGYNNSVAKTGLTQQQFIAAIGQSNTALRKYLSGLNGAQATTRGYITSLVGAKAATIALQAATMALNTVVTMGISLLVSGLITAVQKAIITKQELADKVNEVTSSFEQQKQTINNAKNTLDSVGEKYAKLSKGVNDAGENVSLTAEEFEEYHEVTNQIADMFPTLIQGFDTQGNAILNCKGNVEELTAAYREMVIAANDAMIISGLDIFKQFKQDKKELEQEYLFGANDKLSDRSLKVLQDILNSSDIDKTLSKYYNGDYLYSKETFQIVSAIEDAGIKSHFNEHGSDFIKRAITENRAIVNAIVGDFSEQMAESTGKMASLADAYIENALLRDEKYHDIPDHLSSVISGIVNQIDYDLLKQFDSLDDMYAYLNGLLDSFDKLSTNDNEAFSVYFDIKTRFDNGDCTVSEYLSALANLDNVINGFDEDTQRLIYLSFGINYDDFKKDYNNLINDLVDNGVSNEIATNFIDNLKSKDYEIAVDFVEKFNNKDIIQEKLKEYERDGNVKLTLRPEIDTSILKNAGWDDVGDGIATLFTSTFSNATEDLAVNFTPIIVDDHGNFVDVLSPDELQTYAEGVIAGVRSDDLKLQIGGEFTGDTAIKEAVAEAEHIHVLQDLFYNDLQNVDFNTLTGMFNDYKDALNGVEQATESISFNELMSEGSSFVSDIDEYVEKIQTLQNALDSLSDGSFKPDDLYELQKNFPELIGYTGDLTTAIKDQIKKLIGYNKQVDETNGVVKEATGLMALFEEAFDQVNSEEARAQLIAFMNTVLQLCDVVGNTQFSIDFAAESEGLENLYSAIKESASSTGLTSESIQNIKNRYQNISGYNAATLFEETANGIHLNARELYTLENEYIRLKKVGIDEELKKLRGEYDALTEEINKCNSVSKRSELIAQRDGLVDQINAAATLAAQYDGLTSAYHRWELAQSSGNTRDMYSGIIGGWEAMEEEMSRGWLDDDSVAFLELLSGETLNTASLDKILDVYQGLDDVINSAGYSIQDFFTFDKNGKETTDGIFNFLDTVKAEMDKMKEDGTWDFSLNDWVKIDDDGNYIIDFGVNGDKAVAEALGVSEELVQIILRAAEDAQFVINLDSARTEYADLEKTVKDSVDGVNEALVNMGEEPVSFNFNASSIEEIETQIENAQSVLDKFRNSDGTVNIKAAGALEAQNILATLLTQKQQLEQPMFMHIETDRMQRAQQQAIETLQNLKSTIDELETSITIGADTSLAEAALSNIFSLIDSLPKEMQISLGFTDEDFVNARETLEKSFSGDITITPEIKADALNTIDNKISTSITPEVLASVGVDEGSLADAQSKAESTPATILAGVEVDPVSLSAAQEQISSTPVEMPVTPVIAEGATEAIAGQLPTDTPVTVSPIIAEGASESVTESLPKDHDLTLHVVDDEVNAWEAPLKEGTVEYSATFLDATPPTLTGEVHYTSVFDGATPPAKSGGSGDGIVNGTAHVRGTAFKQGSWGTKHSGVALGGELGQELIVRDGRFFTIGDNGAEFFNYKKDDVIFNADQTRQILEKGKITHGTRRGKALAEGTAFSGGSGGGRVTISGSVNKTPSGGGSKGGGGSSASDEFEEVFDWIETAIDRIERAISRLDLKASSIYKSWANRNAALKEQMAEITKEISLQQQAYDRYMQEANSVGLSESWAKLVRDGAVDIDTITDEGLAEQINDYKEWYFKCYRA